MRSVFVFMVLLLSVQPALCQLSGPLDGTLGPGVYHVVDTISVNSSDSLIISPNATLTFDGPIRFIFMELCWLRERKVIR